MSEIYADDFYGRDDEERATAGLAILLVAGFVAGVLVIAGLVYALGTNSRHNAAVFASGCEPSLFISGEACTTRNMVLTTYQAIVYPASTQLAADVAAYQVGERRNVVGAEAALRAEAAELQALDNSLGAVTFTPQNRARALSQITNANSFGFDGVPSSAVTFTPQITVVADALIRADQTLANLTTEQARSTTLMQMRSLNPKVEAAGAAVQNEMQLLHQAVAAPLTEG
jgi:hypothetical protein